MTTSGPKHFPDQCHEGVYRHGSSEPCDKQAIALRYDTEGGDPYPVCYRHARSSTQMVPLSSVPDVLAELPVYLS